MPMKVICPRGSRMTAKFYWMRWDSRVGAVPQNNAIGSQERSVTGSASCSQVAEVANFQPGDMQSDLYAPYHNESRADWESATDYKAAVMAEVLERLPLETAWLVRQGKSRDPCSDNPEVFARLLARCLEQIQNGETRRFICTNNTAVTSGGVSGWSL